MRSPPQPLLLRAKEGTNGRRLPPEGDRLILAEHPKVCFLRAIRPLSLCLQPSILLRGFEVETICSRLGRIDRKSKGLCLVPTWCCRGAGNGDFLAADTLGGGRPGRVTLGSVLGDRIVVPRLRKVLHHAS
jgi:hypothetical protein